MSRKFSAADKAIFQEVFFQFAWLPLAQLAGMMRVLSQVEALPAKWRDFHGQTAGRWINEGKWRDQVDAMARVAANDDMPLPTDDEIDDRLMRYNLHMLDMLYSRIVGDAGRGGTRDIAVRHFIDLQAQIRTHVQIRRSILLTPTQLIALLIRAGYYAAGKRFNAEKAKEYLIRAFTETRQLLPMPQVDRGHQ